METKVTRRNPFRGKVQTERFTGNKIKLILERACGEVIGWALSRNEAVCKKSKEVFLAYGRLLLWNDLRKLAKQKDLNVVLCTSEMTPRFGGHRRNERAPDGLYEHNLGVIALGPGRWLNPWVLAHEIGHHAGYETVGAQHREVTANDEGRKIVLQFLARPALNIFAPLFVDEIDKELPARRSMKASKKKVERIANELSRPYRGGDRASRRTSR